MKIFKHLIFVFLCTLILPCFAQSYISQDGIRYELYNNGYEGCNEYGWSYHNYHNGNYATVLGFEDGVTMDELIIPKMVSGYLVEEIAPYAFSEQTDIKSIRLPNAITRIGGHAFYGCSGITSITFPEKLMAIDEYAFYGCVNIRKVELSDYIHYVGNYAFSNCRSLTELTLNLNYEMIGIIEEMGEWVEHGEYYIKLGEYSFSDCYNLESVKILGSLKKSSTNDFAVYSYCYNNTFQGSYTQYATLYIKEDYYDEILRNSAWNVFGQKKRIYEGNGEQAEPTFYTLTDDAPYWNTKRYDNIMIMYNRTFNNTLWQSIYLPFEMEYNDWCNDFDLAYINGVRQQDTDNDGIIDYQTMDVIPVKAGKTKQHTPYLIRAKSTGTKTITVNNATLYPAPTYNETFTCSTMVNSFSFKGTYDKLSAETLQNNQFYAMGGGALIIGTTELKPYRWYMSVSDRSSMISINNNAKAKILVNVIGEDSETTGITEKLDETTNSTICRDITGRVVSDSYKGVIIKNGKKIIKK